MLFNDKLGPYMEGIGQTYLSYLGGFFRTDNRGRQAEEKDLTGSDAGKTALAKLISPAIPGAQKKEGRTKSKSKKKSPVT